MKVQKATYVREVSSPITFRRITVILFLKTIVSDKVVTP